MKSPRAIVCSAAVLLIAGAAVAQPDREGGATASEARRGQPTGEARDVPTDPAEARKLLERRLEELTKRQERLRDAMEKINQGVPLVEALRGVDLRGDARGDMRDRRGTEGGPEDRRPDRGERRRGVEGDGAEPRPGERPAPATPEARKHAREFLHEHLPRVAATIEAHDKEHPDQAERNLLRLMPRLAEAEGVMRRDPALFRLRLKEIEGQVAVVEAIHAHREATAANDPQRVAQTTAALRTALGDQLDIRMDLQMHEIEGLSKRVEEMKSDVDRKRAGREEAIDSMLNRMREWRESKEGKGGRDGPGREGGREDKGPPRGRGVEDPG